MERNGKGTRVLGAVAEWLDLPTDVVAGMPRVELSGDREVYVARHSGILAYSETGIDVNTPIGVLRVLGTGLTLAAMTASEVRIGGQVASVEWVRC